MLKKPDISEYRYESKQDLLSSLPENGKNNFCSLVHQAVQRKGHREVEVLVL